MRGLQTGATTRFTVQGSDLLPEPKLLVDIPIADQKLVGTPRANAVEFDVTLDPSVPAGVYHLRLATPGGITPPEIITVDHLPQRAAGPTPANTAVSNVTAEKLPLAVHGQIAGAVLQETRFEGKKGQAITVDVLAARIGSKLRPVVQLSDSTGRQIASALPISHLAGDARFNATLPADGIYTIVVHDLAYAGAAPGHYRLTVGTFDYVDQVFPPVVAAKSSGPLELVGRFGTASTSEIDAAAAAKIATAGNADASLAAALPWPAAAHPIGLRPHIERGATADLVEDRSLDASRKLPTPPPGVSARLMKPQEEDVFHFTVKPGEKWRFEVFGTRLGSPIDASLELRGAKGARLAQNDDAVGPDPRTVSPDPKLEYTVAAGITEVTAAVTDAYRRGGPEMIYRLTAVRLDGPSAAAADFALRLFEDTHLLPAAGSKVLRVEADRAGYNGVIRLSVEGLPAGFTATPAEIGAGSSAALVEIRGPAKQPAFAVGQLRIMGEAVDATPAVRRTAAVATSPLRTLQPWLANDVAVAPTLPAYDLGVAWDAGTDSPLLLGKDRKLTLRFRRGPGAIGPIRLSLLTSQVPVLVNGQPNAMQVLRGSAATVDVPLDPAVKTAFDAHAAAEKALATLESAPAPKDKKPDPKRDEQIKQARAKLDEAAKKLREAEAKLKPTFDYTLTVPADLATIPHDVVLKAELRSLDNQTTLVEAFTPIKHLAISAPAELAVSKEPIAVAFEAKTGWTVTVTGTIRRLEAFAGDITLSVAGLPAGVAAPREVSKGKDEKIQLAIKVPAAFKGKSLEGLRVTASLVPDARRANVTTTLEAKLPAIELAPPTTVAAAAAKVEEPAKKPAVAAKPNPTAAAKTPAANSAVAKPAETKAATKVAPK